MKQTLLVFAFCLVGIYCKETRERTTVSTAERAEGFACKSSLPELGLMRAGEEEVNYKPFFCAKATCDRRGTIIKATCDIPTSPRGCLMNWDWSKPYPLCCPTLNCDGLLKLLGH